MAAPEVTQSLREVGPYDVVELLGFNGVLATLRGVERGGDRNVAMVAVHESSLSSPGEFSRLQQDVTSMANATASRICQPIHCGHDNQHYWVAFEWLHGQHLGGYVRDEGLPDAAQAFMWMSELTDAIATLHAYGSVHQIISPASIFITTMSQVKLLHGFWSPLVLNLETGLTDLALVSILPFLSPEIARGGDFDESADVYSIGANLYFLLTGMPPHWRDDTGALLNAVINETVSLDGLAEQIGHDAVEVLEEMLHRNPDDRSLNLPALSDRLKAISAQLSEWAENGYVPGNDAEFNSRDMPPSAGDMKTRLDIPQQNEPIASSRDQWAQPSIDDLEALRRKQDEDAAAGVQHHYDDEPEENIPSSQRLLHQPQMKSLNEAIAAAEDFKRREMGDEEHPESEPQIEAPQPAAAPPKSKKNSIVLAVAGVLIFIVLGVVGAIVLSGALSEGDEEDDVIDPSVRQAAQQDKAPSAAASADLLAKYDATILNLRALNKSMRAYVKQYGQEPSALSQLEEFGARDSELIDGWGTEVEIRGSFIISAGIDKKFHPDTEGDDIWIDTTDETIGGYAPSLK